MSDDLDDLTTLQRAALGQLQAITNGADIQSEIAILSSVNWDVQRAAEAIFDSQAGGSGSGSGSGSGVASGRRGVEEMEIDDSAQGLPPPYRTRTPITRLGWNLATLITYPLSFSINLLSHLVHFVFRILRIPFPRPGANSITFNFSSLFGRAARPRAFLPDDPASVADRFVRELEEETGAMTVSRARAARREDGPGPSTLAAERDVLFDPGRKLLPDFWLGSYEDALEAAKREARVLCVVLLSDEHDDTPEFRRRVLTDAELVRVLTENNFIVWAGEVRQSEGYQASMKLTATTYPFVAFISLQPRVRSNASAPSNTSLAILSRHSGQNSADALVMHITETILPRITPFLSRLQAQSRARENDRRLRLEQDNAFQASARADAERILRRRAEDAERSAREEAVRRAEREKRTVEERRRAWRRWAQRQLVPEPENGVRIGVKLPDGRRAIRRFKESDELEMLYLFVDGQLYPDEDGHEGDVPSSPPVGYVHEWTFKLAVLFPRSEVPCLPGCSIGEVQALRGGANVVVEGFDRGHESDASDDE